MKLDDFHKMVGITNEEQRRAYYRIHQLGLYSCMKCGEIVYDVMNGCPSCGYDGGRSEYTPNYARIMSRNEV